MQLRKPNTNNDNTETNNIAPTKITTKTAPPSLHQATSYPVSDGKIDNYNNSDDKNENIRTNQDIWNAIANNEDTDLLKLKPTMLDLTVSCASTYVVIQTVLLMIDFRFQALIRVFYWFKRDRAVWVLKLTEMFMTW